MQNFSVEFETTLRDADVMRWFAYNIRDADDDFRLRYEGGGYYSAVTDNVHDRDLILDNPEFYIMGKAATEIQ